MLVMWYMCHVANGFLKKYIKINYIFTNMLVTWHTCHVTNRVTWHMYHVTNDLKKNYIY
jgi:hypothetical protein